MMIGLEMKPRISATGDPIAYARYPSLSVPVPPSEGRVVSYAGEGVASGVCLSKQYLVYSQLHMLS